MLDVVFGDGALTGADVLAILQTGSDVFLESMFIVVFRTPVSGIDFADLD